MFVIFVFILLNNLIGMVLWSLRIYIIGISVLISTEYKKRLFW
jgi:hypothetical protein